MKALGWRMLVGVLLLALLPGCWNRRELNDLGIQMGTAIDKIGDQYQIAVQVVVPGEVSAKNARGNLTPVTMYKAKAATVFEAFRKLTETSPRKIYGAHSRILVLSEEIAKEGISSALDLSMRDPELRMDFYVLVARKTSAEDVLKVLTPLEQIPANKLFSMLETSAQAWAPTTTVTMDVLLDKLMGEGVNPVLTGIFVTGDKEKGGKIGNIREIEPAAALRTTGLAVFRKDRLVGWLNEEESKGYNYITDNVKSTVGRLACPDGGMISLETIRTRTEMKGRIVDGEPVIDIRLSNEVNIGDIECQINIEDEETIRALEEQSAKKGKQLMENAISVVKTKYKSDIFGFGQAINRANPKAWKHLKNDWEEHFVNLKVNCQVETRIRKTGLANTGIKNMIKE